MMNEKQYQAMYQASVQDPAQFWGRQSEMVTWFSPWDEVLSGCFENFDVGWFLNGKLNASYNCLDRHLEAQNDTVAIIWEGDDPKESQKITYGELYQKVCQFSNVLKSHDVKKGDRVCIYLPMIPEIIIAILACARIGAIHSVVFAGFSSQALKTRLEDLACHVVITADEGLRGGKVVPLKKNTDQAIQEMSEINTVIVVKRTGATVPWQEKRDQWYHDLMAAADIDCLPEVLDSDDPLFILYTSGSTGKPKGILHTLGGYLVYVTMSFKYIFNYQQGDIYWCTADLGWITGHSYLLYGPLANGATILLFEGTPTYPSAARYWEIIDKYQVNIFYTAPTAIRALRHEGDQWLESTQRKSLKLLGSVGEPINPDVWAWYYDVVGHGQCPIIDTWWQSETGGVLITPLPGLTPLKPGSAARPFFGIQPEIVDEEGQIISDERSGKLVIKKPWPGFMKSIYKDKKRFIDTYFSTFPGKYLTGDSAYRDQDGYFWIVGRDDDIIKIAGHRIGTGEIESALLLSPSVSEAGVTPIPDAIKGYAIYAYVVLKPGVMTELSLKKELIENVRQTIGAIATIADIQWVKGLPKTRSGKIMRRILKKIAIDEFDDLGDTSTLANPEVVEMLKEERKKFKLENDR